MIQELWFWRDGNERLRTGKNDNRPPLGMQHHDYTYSPFGLLWDSNPNTVYTPGFGHRQNGITSFYHTDWLGSTRYLTDINGQSVAAQAYDAWGKRSVKCGE